MQYKGLTLSEWIERGRVNGTIENMLTVIWAYCIREDEALAWIACIVSGETDEHEALATIRSDARAQYLLSEIEWYRHIYRAPYRPPSIRRYDRH